MWMVINKIMWTIIMVTMSTAVKTKIMCTLIMIMVRGESSKLLGYKERRMVTEIRWPVEDSFDRNVDKNGNDNVDKDGKDDNVDENDGADKVDYARPTGKYD